MGKRTERKSILDRYFATSEMPLVEEEGGGQIAGPDRVRLENAGKTLNQPGSESGQAIVDQNDLTIAAGIFNSQFAVSSRAEAGDSDRRVDASSEGPLFNVSGGGPLTSQILVSNMSWWIFKSTGRCFKRRSPL